MKCRLAMASALLASGVAGCAGHVAKKATPKIPDLQTDSKDENEEQEAVVREDTLHSVEDLKAVHFYYDSSFLMPAARAILVKNATWIKEHPEAEIQVASYCDQRGTVSEDCWAENRRSETLVAFPLRLDAAKAK